MILRSTWPSAAATPEIDREEHADRDERHLRASKMPSHRMNSGTQRWRGWPAIPEASDRGCAAPSRSRLKARRAPCRPARRGRSPSRRARAWRRRAWRARPVRASCQSVSAMREGGGISRALSHPCATPTSQSTPSVTGRTRPSAPNRRREKPGRALAAVPVSVFPAASAGAARDMAEDQRLAAVKRRSNSSSTRRHVDGRRQHAGLLQRVARRDDGVDLRLPIGPCVSSVRSS